MTPATFQQKALELLNNHQYREALVAFEKCEDKLMGWNARGFIYTQIFADPERGVLEYEKIVRSDLSKVNRHFLSDFWFGYGDCLNLLKRYDEAISAFQNAKKFDGDRETADFALGALGAGPRPRIVPQSFVVRLFDGYALKYNEHMEKLKSFLPEKMLEVMTPLIPHPMDILDLGCGTGRAGKAFRPVAHYIQGVDLSVRMLKECVDLNTYNEVHIGDLVEYMNLTDKRFDLVLACDTFPYFGDLTDVFDGVNCVLRPGGFFCFTCERNVISQDSYWLHMGRRFVHTQIYIKTLCGDRQLQIKGTHDVLIHENDGEPVIGDLYVICKPSEQPAQ